MVTKVLQIPAVEPLVATAEDVNELRGVATSVPAIPEQAPGRAIRSEVMLKVQREALRLREFDVEIMVRATDQREFSVRTALNRLVADKFLLRLEDEKDGRRAIYQVTSDPVLLLKLHDRVEAFDRLTKLRPTSLAFEEFKACFVTLKALKKGTRECQQHVQHALELWQAAELDEGGESIPEAVLAFLWLQRFRFLFYAGEADPQLLDRLEALREIARKCDPTLLPQIDDFRGTVSYTDKFHTVNAETESRVLDLQAVHSSVMKQVRESVAEFDPTSESWAILHFLLPLVLECVKEHVVEATSQSLEVRKAVYDLVQEFLGETYTPRMGSEVRSDQLRMNLPPIASTPEAGHGLDPQPPLASRFAAGSGLPSSGAHTFSLRHRGKRSLPKYEIFKEIAH